MCAPPKCAWRAQSGALRLGRSLAFFLPVCQSSTSQGAKRVEHDSDNPDRASVDALWGPHQSAPFAEEVSPEDQGLRQSLPLFESEEDGESPTCQTRSRTCTGVVQRLNEQSETTVCPPTLPSRDRPRFLAAPLTDCAWCVHRDTETNDTLRVSLCLVTLDLVLPSDKIEQGLDRRVPVE